MEMNKNFEICYESDASGLKGKVQGVFFPESAERICEIIKGSGKFDVVPRGFGTGLVGGCVPNNSFVIDMKKMNKVTKFDGRGESVIVEAGVSVKELNEKLRAVGYEFPIFSNDDGSIGGIIALNKISDRSMKYGEVKDWIEEMNIVNGRGEIVKIGKTDLMDVCGMEGITGIIVSAKLKVIPLIKRSISIFQSDEIEEIISIARRLKLEKEVVMLKFYSKGVSKMLGFPEKYHLIIEFDSLRGKIVGDEYERIMKIKDKEKFYFYSKGYYEGVDSKLFYDKIEEFVRFLDRNRIFYSGDLGLGIVCSYFKDNEKIKEIDVFNFLRNTKAQFVKYGFGLKRKDLIEIGEKKVIQRVKMRHDPFGRINRGKVVDWVGEEKSVRPLEGETKSAEKIVEEIKSLEEIKSPDKERVIERVKKVVEEDSSSGEINRHLSDYEKTFNSELIDEKKQRVERFAKDVSREMVKKEENFDYDKIKDMMKDKFGFSGSVKSSGEDEDGDRD